VRLLILYVAVFFLLLLAVNYYEEYRCNNYQEVTGRDSKWVFMDECYVKKYDNTWIKYDSKYKE